MKTALLAVLISALSLSQAEVHGIGDETSAAPTVQGTEPAGCRQATLSIVEVRDSEALLRLENLSSETVMYRYSAPREGDVVYVSSYSVEYWSDSDKPASEWSPRRDLRIPFRQLAPGQSLSMRVVFPTEKVSKLRIRISILKNEALAKQNNELNDPEADFRAIYQKVDEESCVVWSPTFTTTKVRDARRSEFDAARARWAVSRVTDYRMRISAHCTCDAARLSPFEVLNKGKEVVSVRALGETGDFHIRHLQGFLTVNDLFSKVEHAMVGNAVDLKVDYDSNLGYPRSIALDYDNLTYDDELGVEVESFEILNPEGQFRQLGDSRE